MKHIAVLGSTGSIGTSALRVIGAYPSLFSVAALSAHSNVKLLARQVSTFAPGIVCFGSGSGIFKAKGRASVVTGMSGLIDICGNPGVDHVLIAISGSAALEPLLAAIENKKEVSLANKESLVMAGSLVMARAKAAGVKIIPIDSEQSAIWQCLQNQGAGSIRKIYLTASGGPFRGFSRKQLGRVKVQDALKHPRWKMGKKITIDSATLMNKGLEVIEAMHLFGVGPDRIEVLVHPESIIHSMVEFVDGSIMAQLSVTDMRIPIQYALTYPKRVSSRLPKVDFVKLRTLNFEKPDMKTFDCLSLAYRAAGTGGTMPAVMNAANDVAVAGFMDRRLSFCSLHGIISAVMDKHRVKRDPDLGDIKEADAWARMAAAKLVER